MATATRSPLVEQAERIDGLARHLSEGRLLEKPVRLAGSDTVWRGPIRDGFMGWIGQAMDFWVRNQLAEGLRLVARSLFDRAAAVEQAAQQMLATGQVTVAPPALPAPLNYTPGTPPQYGNIGGGENNTFNVPEMRNLSSLLLATADEVMNFARTLDQALQPPPAPPPPPGTPPPINPLPPDAEAVVGYPQVYLEIANQLRSAAMDVAKRADLVMAAEGPMETVTYDLGLADSAASGAAAQATSSDSAAGQAAGAAQQPEEKPPPTEEEIRIAREEGEKLAAKALDEKALEDPKKLKEIAKELEAHKNDPAAEAYAAAFVKKFRPKNMLAIPPAVHSFQTGESREPKTAWERATRPPPSATTEEKEDILFAFSATLATASQSEEFDQKVEDEIFATDDKLALAWLLANPNADFDADFLVRAFEEGVIEQIQDELALTGIGAYGGKSAGDLELVSTKLSTDSKIVVLHAISRNPEAAMRVANIDFDPPLEVGMGVRGPQDVHNVVELLYLGGESNNGYQDNGAALGRMLDSAHRGFCEGGDAGNAKELVDDILGGATSKKDVAAARASLREIGARHPMTDEESQQALDRIRRDPKHPGRELLLAQAAQSKDAANAFLSAPTKDKWKEKALFETQAGWDLVALSLTSKEVSEDQRAAAEQTLEWAIKRISEGEDLTDEARRGLALTLPLRIEEFAQILLVEDETSEAPEKAGIGSNVEQVTDTLKEIAKDDQALGILVSGMGGWVSRTYATLVNHLDKAVNDDELLPLAGAAAGIGDAESGLGQEISQMFCKAIHAVNLEGKDREAKAKQVLGFYQFGVNLAFDVVPGLKSIGDIAVKGVKSGTVTGGIEDQLKESLAGSLAGVNPASIAAKTEMRTDTLEQTLDNVVIENMMTAVVNRPGFMQKAGIPLPDFMFNDSAIPTAPYPDGYPETFLKPEFLQGPPGGQTIRLPGPADGQIYEDFKKQTYGKPDPQGRLYNVCETATEDIRGDMKDCLDEAMGR
jgi:hypothetical protein